ncbi:MAG: J domain-containing protein [Phycisphaerae bacterium]
MFSQEDPYEILGVPRNADLTQVRQAFREAVLRCHPDLCREDPKGAEREFRKLVRAYEAVLEDLEAGESRAAGAARPPRTLTPQDLALMDARQYLCVVDGPGTAGRRGPMGAWKHTSPMRDESALFAILWLVALVLSLLGTLLLAGGLLTGGPADGPGPGTMLLLVFTPLVIYTAMLAGSLAIVFLTRKVVWLVFGFRWRRALPAPAMGPDLPTPVPNDKLPIWHS